MGHRSAENLDEHFVKFGKKIKWNTSYLLQLGMDRPKVNKSFEKK